MSQAEIERFAAAMQTDPGLCDAYRDAADAAGLTARLRSGGYDLIEEEVSELVRRGAELSDEQLDQVTGGGLIAAVAVGGAVWVGFCIAALVGVGVWGAVEQAKVRG